MVLLGIMALALGLITAGPGCGSKDAEETKGSEGEEVAPAEKGEKQSAPKKATEKDAKALLEAFLKSDCDHRARTLELKPAPDDYKAIFIEEVAEKAKKSYEGLWSDPNAAIKPKPGQTDLLLWKATSEDLAAWTGGSSHFPGGWKDVGSMLRPGLTFYRWKFVEPGKTSGMAFDGLVHVNGHWVFVPKPYRALR